MFATDGWAVGTTKLFLKASHQQQLEVARESHLRCVITQTLTKAIADQDLASLDEAVARAVEIRLTGKLVEEAKALLATLRVLCRRAAPPTEVIMAHFPRVQAGGAEPEIRVFEALARAAGFAVERQVVTAEHTGVAYEVHSLHLAAVE